MKRSEAEVSTDNASSYLRKLCQHWSHKFTVAYDDQQGTIELPQTLCVLHADAATLRVRLEMEGDGDEDRMEQVVAEHLQRFGFKETLVFAWVRS